MTLRSTTRLNPLVQQAVSIPAALRSRCAARNVPMTAGLCLPKGHLTEACSGEVLGFDRPVAAQFEVLNRWNDGSVRWMLASFVAPQIATGRKDVAVIAEAEKTSPDSLANAVTTVKFVRGELVLTTQDLSSDPPTSRTIRMTPVFRDSSGKQILLQSTGIREEVSGPIRQVFLISTRLQSLPFVTIQMRLTRWSDTGLLHLETRIRNTRRARHTGGLWDLGDSGSLLFCGLEATICSDEIPRAATTHWKAERQTAVRTTSAEVVVRQHGSGGRHWRSSSHINADNRIETSSRGYEAQSDRGTLRGYRAEPAVLIEGDSAFLSVAVPEFWQQFPGSIRAAECRLEVGLFPTLADRMYELQGGEQKTQSLWIMAGPGPGDVHALDWVYDVPRLQQSPESIADAGTLPWFSGRISFPRTESETSGNFAERQFGPNAASGTETAQEKSDPAGRFAQYLHRATTGAFSLQSRRESIDEFGWRNFGDIPADHEQTHYAGANTVVSHYNNQFDMIFGSILQAVWSGDLRWYDLFDPLARHVMDIDIYHTSEDRAAFNGGLFWHTDHYVDARTSTHRTYSRLNQKFGQPYGGGPSCEHNYTTGLLHYHFLTGSVEARESVLSLAEWVIQMDDGRSTVFGLLDNGPTGAASATVFEDFHGPGRGAGNSINALLDAWLLTNSSRYRNKLEEIIRRCVHPSQNPDELHLLDAEGHWSYTVFLNSLGRCLLAFRDAECFDELYSYARKVMQTYGRWMALHERRTLDRPEDLQYPTEAWAAQDLRKANVLRIAASCEDDSVIADTMRTKADEIADAAWRDFTRFGTASLSARCLSIVMTEGHREVFHRLKTPEAVPQGAPIDTNETWTMFVPQKMRVRKLLKSPRQLLKASFLALHPSRLIPAVKALRRQL